MPKEHRFSQPSVQPCHRALNPSPWRCTGSLHLDPEGFPLRIGAVKVVLNQCADRIVPELCSLECGAGAESRVQNPSCQLAVGCWSARILFVLVEAECVLLGVVGHATRRDMGAKLLNPRPQILVSDLITESDSAMKFDDSPFQGSDRRNRETEILDQSLGLLSVVTIE
jgi:hypothetical protein